MYEPGAEARYMEHLGDIREDMEDLNSLALSETGSELKLAAKKILCKGHDGVDGIYG